MATLDRFAYFVGFGKLAVVVADLDCSVVYDCPRKNHLDSLSCARLPPQSAATYASKYSCPYKLQMIEHRDKATPPVVLPFAGAFALTPQNPVYLSLII